MAGLLSECICFTCTSSCSYWFRTNGEQNLDDMPLQQRTASFAVLPGAYMQQLADDQGHSMWPPYSNLMARQQVNQPETLNMLV